MVQNLCSWKNKCKTQSIKNDSIIQLKFNTLKTSNSIDLSTSSLLHVLHSLSYSYDISNINAHCIKNCLLENILFSM